MKRKSVNKKLHVEESEDNKWVKSEKTSSPFVSPYAAFSSEGVELCECAWVLHVLEASLETVLLERPSSFTPARRLLCVRLHSSAPFLVSICFSLQPLKLLTAELTKLMCFKKRLSLRSRFLISSSHHLYVRCLESIRTGFFSLSVGLVETEEFSLSCFRKSKNKVGFTYLNSFTTIITVNMD